MKKPILTFIVAIMCSISLFNTDISGERLVAVSIDINSKYAIVYNLNDNRIMYTKSAEDKMYPASLTKMMTALVAIDKIKDLDGLVTVSAASLQGLSASGASVAGFKENERVTYRDLLYGLLLPSGADAANQLGLSLYSSNEKMVKAMNAKAKQLKLGETHFTNLTGLHDDNHYSSASDLLTILQRVIKNKDLKQIISTNRYTTSDGALTFTHTLLHHEALTAADTSYIKGGKTGFTYEAGQCLASYAEKNGETYLSILGNAAVENNSAALINDATTLYSHFFDDFTRVTLFTKGKVITKANVSKAHQSQVGLVAKQDLSALLPNNYDKKLLKVRFHNQEALEAPLDKHQYLGEVSVRYDSGLVATCSVYASKQIDKTLISNAIDIVKGNWAYIILLILVSIYSVRLYKRYNRIA